MSSEVTCHIMKKDASSKCEYSQINQNLYINEGAREILARKFHSYVVK